MATATHIPVLLQEAIEALAVQPGGRYIDCTLGAGGHAEAILEHNSPGGQLLGIDADPQALELARERLKPYKGAALTVNDNFTNLQAIGIKYDFYPVHGILLDLGLSSLQLASGRGFSFQSDEPLDMRFGPGQEMTAADIVNDLPQGKLARLIRDFGEERHSHPIARSIVKHRPIRTTTQLVSAIEAVAGIYQSRLHPATKTFQALRIAVNHELENLEAVLKQALDLLGYEGRLVVISYHSLEDRRVKHFMQREAKDCICPPEVPHCVCGHTASLRLVKRKVTVPSPDEVRRNPRSRSARLRAAERITVNEAPYKAVEGLCVVSRGKSIWRKPVLLKRLQRVSLTV